MKRIGLLVSAFLVMAATTPLTDLAIAQPSSSPVWGLYAHGQGKRVTDPTISPCDIGYQVRLVGAPDVAWGVAHGTLVAIYENVPRGTAEAGLRRFGRFHDDEPDGVVKMSSCESAESGNGDDGGGPPSASPRVQPGTYSCQGFGRVEITRSSQGYAAGTYSSTWDKSAKGWIRFQMRDGRWTGTWGEDAVGRRGSLQNVTVSNNSLSGNWVVTTPGRYGERALPKNKGPFSCTKR